MTNIFLIEDHPLMLRVLSEFIDLEPDLTVSGTAASAEEGLEAIAGLELDLVLVDLSLPAMSGIGFVETLQARQPELKILVVSGHDESLYAHNAIRAGACGYVMKDEPSEIIKAIHAVLRGDIYLSSSSGHEAHSG